jgi:CheY-like chemotaxis protein
VATTGAGRVLIAEDNPVIQAMVAEYLRLEGFDVVVANNGAEALTVARQARPDVAVVDMYMPVMDGFQLLAFWKEDGTLSAVPVVLVSAAANLGDVAARFNVRATLAKPFDLDQLGAIIGQVREHPKIQPGRFSNR